MKKALLVCSFGMSTSFLTKKVNDLAAEHNVPITFFAKSENALEGELDSVDCILIGPQLAYMEESILQRVNGKVPVEKIDPAVFGRMNAAAILKQAVHMLRESK